MLFPYLYKSRIDDTFVVFHPLTFDVVFFSGNPDKGKMDDADIEEAVRQTDLAAHWCVEDDFYYMFGYGGIYNFISRCGDLLITVDGLDPDRTGLRIFI